MMRPQTAIGLRERRNSGTLSSSSSAAAAAAIITSTTGSGNANKRSGERPSSSLGLIRASQKPPLSSSSVIAAAAAITANIGSSGMGFKKKPTNTAAASSSKRSSWNEMRPKSAMDGLLKSVRTSSSMGSNIASDDSFRDALQRKRPASSLGTYSNVATAALSRSPSMISTATDFDDTVNDNLVSAINNGNANLSSTIDIEEQKNRLFQEEYHVPSSFKAPLSDTGFSSDGQKGSIVFEIPHFQKPLPVGSCRKLLKGVEKPAVMKEGERQSLIKLCKADELMDHRLQMGYGDFVRPIDILMPTVEEATPRKGQSVGHHKDAEYYIVKAQVYKERNNLREALRCYQTALSFEHHPASLDYRTMTSIGVLMHEMEEHSIATKHFAAVAKNVAPENPKAHYNLGVSLIFEGLYSKAITALNRAIAIDAENPKYYQARAIAYRKMGKFQQSMDDHNRHNEVSQQQREKTDSGRSKFGGKAKTQPLTDRFSGSGSIVLDRLKHLIPDLGNQAVGFGQLEEFDIEGETGTGSSMWTKLTERARDKRDMIPEKKNLRDLIRHKVLQKPVANRFLGIVEQQERKAKMKQHWRNAIDTALCYVHSKQTLDHRSLVACKRIASWLKDTHFFANLPSLLILRLSQRMKIRTFKKGEIIIRQGDTSSCSMFVLVFGQASVWVHKDLEPWQLPDLTKSTYSNAYKCRSSFGEVSLHSGQPRSATVKVESENAIVLELEKEDYDSLSRRWKEELTEMKMNQLMATRIFASTKDTQLQIILNHMQRRILRKGEVLLTQGQHISKIFLILNGRCALFRKPNDGTEVADKANMNTNTIVDDDDQGGSMTQERDIAALEQLSLLDQMLLSFGFGMRGISKAKLETGIEQIKPDVRPDHAYFEDTRRIHALISQYGRPLTLLGRPNTLGEEAGMSPTDFKGNSLFTAIAIEDMFVFEIDKYEIFHLGMAVINLAADNLIQRIQDIRKHLQEQLGWSNYRQRLLSDVIYDRSIKKTAR